MKIPRSYFIGNLPTQFINLSPDVAAHHLILPSYNLRFVHGPPASFRGGSPLGEPVSPEPPGTESQPAILFSFGVTQRPLSNCFANCSARASLPHPNDS